MSERASGRRDVGEPRRDDAALRRARPRRRPLALVHHTGREPLPYQLQHPSVRDASGHQREQVLMVDAAEIIADVGVQHMVTPACTSHAQRFQCLRRAALRPEAIRRAAKIRFEDGLQHERRGHLRYSVSNRRDAERPLTAIGLRDVSAQNRLRTIRACAQGSGEFLHEALDAVLLDDRERRTIDTRGPAVPLHPPPCLLEDVTPPDPVHQGMKASLRGSRGRDPESAWQLAHVVGGRMSAGGVGTGPAGHALARACSTNVTTAGTLRSARVMRHGPPHYDGPLGLPLRTTRFRHRLIRAALPRLGPRRRVSRVPFVSLHACCALYPAETGDTCSSGLRHRRHGLRRDMTGSALGL